MLFFQKYLTIEAGWEPGHKAEPASPLVPTRWGSIRANHLYNEAEVFLSYQHLMNFILLFCCFFLAFVAQNTRVNE